VIAVEKRLLSPLQEPSSVEKLFEVDSHVGAQGGREGRVGWRGRLGARVGHRTAISTV
jgi:hypothetical protein